MITAPDPASISAPVLASVARMLMERPVYFATDPLPVDPMTFEGAKAEMTEVLRSRGWAGPGSCKEITRPNFMLMGVPIVRADE